PPDLRLLEQCEAERAALRGKRDAAGRERPARERRVQAPCRRADAKTIRADQARAVRPDEREELVLPGPTLRARLREPRGDDAKGMHPRAQRAFRRVEHRGARDADDCKIDLSGNLLDRAVARDASDRVSLGVDRVSSAVEIATDHVAKQLATD